MSGNVPFHGFIQAGVEVSNVVVFPLDTLERYDAIADALSSCNQAELRLTTGESFEVSSELLTVIVEAAHYLARGKAVTVNSLSRQRFL